MNPRQKYRRKQQLLDEGWNVTESEIQIHNADETPKHLTLKAMVALRLQQMGRPWDTEVEVDGKGVIDVVEWGEDDGRATAYEVETAYTPQRAKEKAKQYAGGIVRDVIVIPVQEAPDDPDEMLDWLEGYVV